MGTLNVPVSSCEPQAEKQAFRLYHRLNTRKETEESFFAQPSFFLSTCAVDNVVDIALNSSYFSDYQITENEPESLCD